MATSSIDSDSPSPVPRDASENNLQPFFVLHKSSSARKPAGRGKTRRRIDITSKSGEEELEKSDKCQEELDELRLMNLRFEAFEAVWSTIDSTIKGVLRGVNTGVFNEIHQWACECFNEITSLGKPNLLEATRPFPMVVDASNKQLFTGLVLTKNMEFVDDLLTFKDLGLYLKSKGCHVANLSSLDFSMRNGIGGCLSSLLRQFLMVTLDVPDISILATWYGEQENHTNPIVVIIDDIERCCGSVLADFILMLSEWILKIPVILVMGVATTLDAVRNILPSNALQSLCPSKFNLGTPSERMDAVAEAVLMKHCSGFSISHKVAVFMRNYFLNQEGTVTSFIRALKIACAQHFSGEPLSYLLPGFHLGMDNQVLLGEKYGLSQEMLLKHAFDFPSSERNKIAELNAESLVHAFSELKKSQIHWSIVMKCLYEAIKSDKIWLLDLLCEGLDPELYKSRVSDASGGLRTRVSPTDIYMSEQSPCIRKDGLIYHAVRKVRDLPAVQLHKLLKVWKKHTPDIPEVHGKIKELLSMLKLNLEDGNSMKQDLTDISKKSDRRHASRSRMNTDKDGKAVNEKAVALVECMVRNSMQPSECLAFHEIVCFKNVEKLEVALIGDPRRRIQLDLMEFHKNVQCTCCRRSGNTLLPSMPESSIMIMEADLLWPTLNISYVIARIVFPKVLEAVEILFLLDCYRYTLAQEHGDIINLHDWYLSFKTIVLSSGTKRKQKSKYSPSPKKRKAMAEPAKPGEASIQARFCRAITELQITGLVRMPSKRRPDYVQRVAFGP